jgi:hypothetical protein
MTDIMPYSKQNSALFSDFLSRDVVTCRLWLGDHAGRAGGLISARRSRQVVKGGWASRLRGLKALGKKKA